MKYLRSFKFEDLTYRGTVEFRSVCTQPVRDLMSVAAFHTGLMENLPALSGLLESDTVLYHKGYNPTELREWLNRRSFPSFLKKWEISSLLTDAERSAVEQVEGLGDSVEITSIELFGDAGPSIPITIPLPDKVKEFGVSTIQGFFDRIRSLYAEMSGVRVWE